MLKLRPRDTGVSQESFLSRCLDPEVRAVRGWDSRMRDQNALGRNCQRTISRSPTGQCPDLEVEPERTFVKSKGGTISLWFSCHKTCTVYPSTYQTACQVPGETQRPFRREQSSQKKGGARCGWKMGKDPESAASWLRVWGQVLHPR